MLGPEAWLRRLEVEESLESITQQQPEDIEMVRGHSVSIDGWQNVPKPGSLYGTFQIKDWTYFMVSSNCTFKPEAVTTLHVEGSEAGPEVCLIVLASNFD